MILKFGTSDILNTTLIDPRTRSVIYNITTLPINEEKSPSDLPLRRTCIYDTEGCVVGKIGWQGQQPQDIAIVDETVGDLTRLFGSSTVRFQPKIISIPTRFDSEFVWTASSHSLILFDYKTEETKGEFHLNSIRIGDHFFKTHVPGLGGNYLEFQDHPSALSVEIIITFIVMEILRRGRFYPKQCKCSEIPKLWKWCDAHASVVSLG